MRTCTRTYGFAALTLAVLALVGCGGKSSSSTNTGGGTTPPVTTSAQWTWIAGSNTVGSVGSYGTLGTGAASNQPAARYGAAYWTDASGNFYTFGGLQNGSTTLLFMNDLWRYSPSTGQWTWLSGSNSANQTGNYGTINVAAGSNVPGGRLFPAFWRDTSGNLYLFGGIGVDKNGVLSSGPVYMNDLWKYNISANQWTWIGGSSSGANGSVAPTPATYGTQGTASASNLPGVRYNSVSVTDSSGNFWLFGGVGGDANGTFGSLSDLWKYSTTTNQWTWVAGPNMGNQASTYGTQGTAAASNTPSGRYNSSGWADSSGNIWIFGGSQGATTSGTNGPTSTFTPINDLWEFTPSNNQWTWVAGSNSAGAAGSYGTKGTAASGNTPGARAYGATWVDSSGNLYLFGGGGGTGTSGTVFNDLWKFSPSSKQWAWVAGPNAASTSATYGTQGTSSASNVPGGRIGSSSWIDGSGNLWLFGGLGIDSTANFNTLNDLWRYQP